MKHKVLQFLSSRTGAYILLTLAFFLANEIIASNIEWEGSNGIFAQIRRLADAAMLALPVVILPTIWLSLPWVIIVSIYQLANVYYYRFYGSYIPLSSLFLWGNLSGLGDSIIGAIKWTDIGIILPSIAWIIIYSCTKIKYDALQRRTGAIALLFCIITSIAGYIPKQSELRNFQVFFTNPSKAIKQYGLINYWIAQIDYMRGYDKEDIDYVTCFLQQTNTQLHLQDTTNTPNTPKNLIIITVESLSSWYIDTNIYGQTITPNINHLIKDSSTIYMRKCLSQVHDGRSSDFHLMLNTGLLPLKMGAASNLCQSHSYYALPKALHPRGFTSTYYVCDNKYQWWHQETNYHQYGIDTTIDQLGNDDGKDIPADELLFSRAWESLASLNQPFYVNLVTFSMHELTSFSASTIVWNDDSSMDQQIRNHLMRANYTDNCIAKFLDTLKVYNLYDQSIIVIVGDHFLIPYNQLESRSKPELSDFFVPLIILNSPIKPERTDMVFGQIDIYPSLLDLMGVGDYVWRGLGESIFTPGGHSGCAVYHTGEAIGNTENDSIVAHKRNLWRISDIILRSDYFRKHPLE